MSRKLRRRARRLWITCYPPEFLGGQDKPLVKVLFRDPEDLVNRITLVKGSTITGRFQDRALNLFFRVIRVQPQGAFTSLVGAELGKEEVSSKVRRRTTKIELVTRYKTKNEVTVKVSMFAVTVHRCNKRDEKAVRRFYNNFLKEKITNAETHEELIYDLAVDRKWNQKMIKEASQIYPVRDLVIEKVRAEDFIIPTREISEVVQNKDQILTNAEKFS
ncbi:MAG: hypothetical protein GWO20_11995 [Candidatus Korarchaeota archaeon]|nr:hypothetical protein [Candidatus Korarchaeota archaeon]NIU84153.1 hypothetical protein [Candidatus Thorarchaeota archaeon]NIW14298.1 hypothetical protein [Candidatus Thorarchaeota archaeon]NIW52395.1 hypothetical protein [Candidatus Korarchaeota archaeon]